MFFLPCQRRCNFLFVFLLHKLHEPILLPCLPSRPPARTQNLYSPLALTSPPTHPPTVAHIQSAGCKAQDVKRRKRASLGHIIKAGSTDYVPPSNMGRRNTISNSFRTTKTGNCRIRTSKTSYHWRMLRMRGKGCWSGG